MTREEAIRIIKIVLAVAENFEITVQGEEFTEEKCEEAVDMAIEALSSSGKHSSEPTVTYKGKLLTYAEDGFVNKYCRKNVGKTDSCSEKPNKWIDADVLDKIRDEVVHLHDWAFTREEILRIIDKYKAESGDEG